MTTIHLRETLIETLARRAALLNQKVESAERFHLRSCPICLQKYEFFFEFYQTLAEEQCKPIHPSVHCLAASHHPAHLQVLHCLPSRSIPTANIPSPHILPVAAQSISVQEDRLTTLATFISDSTNTLVRITESSREETISFYLLAEGGQPPGPSLIGLVENDRLSFLVLADDSCVARMKAPGKIDWSQGRLLVFLPVARFSWPEDLAEGRLTSGGIIVEPYRKDAFFKLSVSSPGEPIHHAAAILKTGRSQITEVEGGKALFTLGENERIQEILLYN